MPEFVALTQWLAAPQAVAVEEPPMDEEEVVELAAPDELCDDLDGALADVRMFRAALAEAIELRANEIAKDIAIEVLAREMQLAPCDLAAIVERARKRYHLRDVLEIRVHPDDATALLPDETIVCDYDLRRGDVVLASSCGSIDATLGARLDRVLRAVR